MMQLHSTKIVGDRVELVFASDPRLDDADQLISIRMPRRADSNDSLALHQLQVLNDAFGALEAHRFQLDRVVNES